MGATIAVALSTSIVIAAEKPLLLVADPPAKVGTNFPTMTPTGDGYAVAWLDDRNPTPSAPDGTPHFRRFDLSGRPISEETVLEISDSYPALDVALLRAGDGFLYVAQLDGYAIHTVSLDALGRPAGPSRLLHEGIELYLASAVATSSTVVVTFPAWIGQWATYAEAVKPDGRMIGKSDLATGHAIGGTSTDPYFAWVEAPSACSRQKCFSVWSDVSVSLELREFDERANPVGGLVTLGVGGAPFERVAAAWLGATEVIVYSTGTKQLDVMLLTRDGDGTVHGPVPLAAEPYNEGGEVGGGSYPSFPVGVASAGDRIGVLWSTDLPGNPWMFREFAGDGTPIGTVRNISEEFGINIYAAARIAYDSRNDRYVVWWQGSGADGAGIYALPLAPRR